ncbi:SMP-30/gluconolactonase/LRE family protein [Alloalcanivorax mobilis]|uniref:SMP-30/gluconolactonase/LRE family protein n=1 Tax=Alloalcanivorax mobilis TaxID=2019569 RepID=UPI000B5B42DC|nr:SMP-30/gluconolactonase/LRE family protein [Alloalcanivorax mobilis]ASK34040.1 gluconolactonase [Alcanivorax sp. N3-2A]|tara:strand:- start:23219 stop:24307 length:1089 start_codon:yes stop_codon:yes gene_type:complete
MKKIIALIVLVILAGYLLFWPVPINAVAWKAPAAPALDGPFQVNDKLAAARKLGIGQGHGPEDVAIDDNGQLYVGYEDGSLVRFDGNGEHPDLITNTGGRPFGLDFAPDGTLVVADGYRGLLRVNTQSGAVTLLSDGADGVPFRFTDDVDVARDGTVYFSDASSKFGPANKARDDIIEHGGHGRLLKYDPATGTTTVLLKGLQFANGVALAADESFVLVTETGSYDVVRYWLTGDKAGSHDLFYENLPGIPDGISSNGADTFWVALFAPRNRALDTMSDKPLLREMVFRLPEFMQPQPAHHAFVLGLDERGKVTHNLQYRDSNAFSPITSVEQRGNRLYLGSLTANGFAVYALDQPHTESTQ